MRVVDQGHGRLCHRRQTRDFAGVVHPKFHHSDAVFWSQAQQGQWNANVVVEVASRGQGVLLAVGCHQDRGQHLCDRGLAIATGHGDQWQVESGTPGSGQFGQRDFGVRHFYAWHADQAFGRTGMADRRHRTFLLRLGKKVVRIKSFALESDKQIARLDRAGIGMHPLHVHVASAAPLRTAQPGKGLPQGHHDAHAGTPGVMAKRDANA